MIQEIYGIYDLAAECYVQILPAQNEAIARMTLTKLFKEKRLQIPLLYDYPNLYQVQRLAMYDDNKGKFENVESDLLLNFGSLDTETFSVS